MAFSSLPHDVLFSLLCAAARDPDTKTIEALSQTTSSLYQISKAHRTLLLRAHLEVINWLKEDSPAEIQILDENSEGSLGVSIYTPVPGEPPFTHLLLHKDVLLKCMPEEWSFLSQVEEAKRIYWRIYEFASFTRSLHWLLWVLRDYEPMSSHWVDGKWEGRWEVLPSIFPKVGGQDEQRVWMEAVCLYAIHGLSDSEQGKGDEEREGWSEEVKTAFEMLKVILKEIIYELCYAYCHPKNPNPSPAGLPPAVIICYGDDEFALARAPLVAYITEQLFTPVDGWEFAADLLGDGKVMEDDLCSHDDETGWEFLVCRVLEHREEFQQDQPADELWDDIKGTYEAITEWSAEMAMRELKWQLTEGIWDDEGLWYDVSDSTKTPVKGLRERIEEEWRD